MPTINKLQPKPKQPRKQTNNKQVRSKAYNNRRWRKVRDTYFIQHPLCEECLKKGKVTPAEDVHHLKSPFINGEINYTLLLDSNNLESLCKECHSAIHNKKKESTQDIINKLSQLLYDNQPDNNEIL